MSIGMAREKILNYSAIGEEKMTDITDILSVIVGPRVKKDILQSLSELKVRDLFRLSIHEMEQIGLSKNQAVSLHGAILLSRRYMAEEKGTRYVVRSPEDAADYLMEEMRHFNQEHLVVLFLDTKNQIIKKKTLFIGSLNASIVHPREIMREAVKCGDGCASIILAHNHPSGSSQPSQEDIHLTRRITESSKVIGTELLDHVIIGNREFTSLKEKGYV